MGELVVEMMSKWRKSRHTQTLANRQTKTGGSASLDELSRMFRMADMASAVATSILTPQKTSRHRHSHGKIREARERSAIATAGAGEMRLRIDGWTTLAINEETMLGHIGVTTAI
jgi:hypothetical protein